MSLAHDTVHRDAISSTSSLQQWEQPLLYFQRDKLKQQILSALRHVLLFLHQVQVSLIRTGYSTGDRCLRDSVYWLIAYKIQEVINKNNLAVSPNSFSVLSSMLNRLEKQVHALAGQHRVPVLLLTGDHTGGMLHWCGTAETHRCWHRRGHMLQDCFLAEKVRLYP